MANEDVLITPASEKIEFKQGDPQAVYCTLTGSGDDFVVSGASTLYYKAGDGLNYFNGGSGENRLYVFDNGGSGYATYSAKYLELRDGSANVDVKLNAEGASYFVHRVGFGITVPLSDPKITLDGTMAIKERGSAHNDTADYGQLWVKNDTPNKLYFTDDAGADHDLTAGGGSPGGSTTQMQYNNGGAFGGTDNLYWIDGSDRLYLSGTTAELRVGNYGQSAGINFGTNADRIFTDSYTMYIQNNNSMIFNIDSNNNHTGQKYEWRHNAEGAGGTALMTLGDDGNLGIGTTSPGEELHVVGNITGSSNLNLGTGVELQGGGTSTFSNAVNIGATNVSQNTYLKIMGSGSGYTSAGIKLLTYNGADRPGGVYSYNNVDAEGWYSGPVYGASYKWGVNYKSSLANTGSALEEVAAVANNFLIIDTAGNVGIGTTSPNVKLHVNGDARIEAGHKLYFDDTGTGEYIYATGNDLRLHASDHLVLDAEDQVTVRASDFAWETDGASEKMRFKADTGRLGIGTNAPSRKLDVYSTSTAVLVSGTGGGTYGVMRVVDTADTTALEVVGQRSDGEGPVLRLNHESASVDNGDYVGTIAFDGYDSGGARSDYAWIRGRIRDKTAGGEDGSLYFQVAEGNSRTDVMTLSGTKVGIGTTSPSELFNVESASNTLALFKSTDNRGLIQVADDDTTVSLVAEGSMASLGLTSQLASTNLNIDAAGNVGIGTTNPIQPLHVLTSANDKGILIDVSDDTHEGRLIFGDTSSNAAGHIGYNHALGAMRFFTEGTEIMRTTSNTLTVTGTISATAKSFNIPHPLYKDKRLVHGSLEGPEHGLYIRGTIEAFKGCLIELPEYWSAMCEDYTVQLTPHGPYTVYIKEKQKDKVMVECSEENYKFDYYIVGARTDETLEVVQDA